MKQGEERQFVEEWAGRMKLDPAVLAGVMEFEGWKHGKTVSERQFRKALDGFLGQRAG